MAQDTLQVKYFLVLLFNLFAILLAGYIAYDVIRHKPNSEPHHYQWRYFTTWSKQRQFRFLAAISCCIAKICHFIDYTAGIVYEFRHSCSSCALFRETVGNAWSVVYNVFILISLCLVILVELDRYSRICMIVKGTWSYYCYWGLYRGLPLLSGVTIITAAIRNTLSDSSPHTYPIEYALLSLTALLLLLLLVTELVITLRMIAVILQIQLPDPQARVRHRRLYKTILYKLSFRRRLYLYYTGFIICDVATISFFLVGSFYVDMRNEATNIATSWFSLHMHIAFGLLNTLYSALKRSQSSSMVPSDTEYIKTTPVPLNAPTPKSFSPDLQHVESFSFLSCSAIAQKSSLPIVGSYTRGPVDLESITFTDT